MNGRYNDRWSDPNEPSWVVEPTTEWHPQFPGQRYAGDIGRPHQPPPRGRASVSGRAEVPPLAPTRPDGTYLGRSWSDEPPEEQAPHGRSWVDDEPGETPAYGRLRGDERSADTSAYGRPDSADSRHYDHEPYRRPLPEPPRRDDRRSPESDRRTAWSDRRPADERGPTREAAWHRDQPTPDRYDSRRPRQEPTERDRGYQGSPPVSPAPRPEPGWVPESDDTPRRRGTPERPAAGYERHTGDAYGGRPNRDHDGRIADGVDPWAPVDGRTRYSADGHPDRAADDLRRPDSRYRADEGIGAAPSPNGGRRRRPEADLPDQPRLDDDRRRPDTDPHRQQPREAAARTEAYPDRRPREQARPDGYRDNGYREDAPREDAYREPRPQPGQRSDRSLPWPAPGPVRQDRTSDRTREPGHRSDPHRSPDPHRPTDPHRSPDPHRTADPHRSPDPHRPTDPYRGAEPGIAPRPAARPDRPAATPSRPDERPAAAPARYDERQARPAATAPPASGRAMPVPPVSPERPVSPAPVSPAWDRPVSAAPASPERPVSPAPDSPAARGWDRPVSAAPVSPAETGWDRPVSAVPVSPASDRPVSGPPAARLRLEYLPAPVDPPTADERSDAPPASGRQPLAEPPPASGAHPAPPPRYPGPDTRDRPADQRRGEEPGPDRRRVGDPLAGTPPTDRRPTAPDRSPPAERPHPADRPAVPQRPYAPERLAPTADARPSVAPPPTWQAPPPPATRPDPTPADPTRAVPAPAASQPPAAEVAPVLPPAPGTPRRYVPPPPSEEPVAAVHEPDDVPGTRGPEAWFSPAQPAESDQAEPATDQRSFDPVDDESTSGDPDLTATPVAPDAQTSAAAAHTHLDVADEHASGSTPDDAFDLVSAPPAHPVSGAPRLWPEDLDDDPQPDFDTGTVDGDEPVSGAPVAMPHQRTEADLEAEGEADQQPFAASPSEDSDPVGHDPTDELAPPDELTDAIDDPSASPTDGSRGDAALHVTAADDTSAPVSAPPVSAPPAAPVSAPPASATAPISAPPAPTAAPVSAPPFSTAPVSAPPAPVSAPPASARPYSVAPVSAPPAPTQPHSVAPVSAPPAPTTAPVSAPPAATPMTAPPASTPPPATAPVSGPPASVVPASGPPASAVPGPRIGSGGENEPVSAPPDHTPPVVTRPSLADPGDPEQVLAAYRWRLDPVTLREELTEPDDLRAIRRRLTEKLGSAVDNRARARLLSLRAVASRILGDLDDALADGRLALTYAEATGELRRTALAQARLAHVLRWRGDFAEADQLFAQANSVELPDRLRAALHEHAGRSCYDQGRLMEACEHFEKALDLRGAGDAELLDRVRVALDAVTVRAEAGGFGAYPRSRDEVLDRDRPPLPDRDGQLWGYTSQDGDMVVPARYAEAQPFHDGLAWVRRPDTDRWSLINLLGTTVIPPSFRAAQPFSDGLAWVVGEGGWTAIDATGAVQVPPNFAEVRPFRRGLAAVRREGWGAVDRTGRVIVPTRYHGFVTELADGQQIDGFTDEGLAVVDMAGRRGVVDRTGTVLVPPAHPMLVIHPVAFLIESDNGRWGALDRRGVPLIDPVHRDLAEVLEEIDRLLTDANPVL
ncbi:WG repeat-containing protein [Micromonospora noduli]|uniref:WG repeat-containing protein n=1 Tax=Micromonospora noduli TaxID=709876 RepID=UPI000DC28754|nr:WG repeat-containing protein [Micromonospora noduli]RAO21672.1 Galacturan 1,4-alpha-galacturonidase [Micromonospora noduli]